MKGPRKNWRAKRGLDQGSSIFFCPPKYHHVDLDPLTLGNARKAKTYSEWGVDGILGLRP